MPYHVLSLGLIGLVYAHGISNVLVTLLDVSVEITAVIGQLATLELNDVTAHFIQEPSVVTDNQESMLIRYQVAL
jgi:hypothetical protein